MKNDGRKKKPTAFTVGFRDGSDRLGIVGDDEPPTVFTDESGGVNVRFDSGKLDSVVVKNQSNLDLTNTTEGDPVWPSPQRRRRVMRGLPTDQNIRKLAAAWLDYQWQAWPQLQGTDLLPEKSEAVLDQMVADFKERFTSGEVTAIKCRRRVPWKELGTGYLRYSADTSNPRSLDDQLVNALRRAHTDRRFIPWDYVYLSHRNWIFPIQAQVDIHQVPRYQQIAAEVVRELEAGADKRELATRLGISTSLVDAAWRYGKHGVADTHYKPELKSYNPPIPASTRQSIADEVARLRHEEHMMFDAIAERFGVTRTTIERAHALWHEQHPDHPDDVPWKLLCGRHGQFTVDQRRQIIQLNQQGLNSTQIAQKLELPLWPVKNQLQTYRRYCMEHNN